MSEQSNEKGFEKPFERSAFRSASNEERAVIAAGTSIRGDITGTQDILIQGNVEGTISLRENVVTIGNSARVKADVVGRVIHVEGEVEGDLIGTEKVIVHATGNVRGNITAPRLSLEDGARLKGAIDTDPDAPEKRLSDTMEKGRGIAAKTRIIEPVPVDNGHKSSKTTEPARP